MLVGEPGIGKTRLAEVFAAECRALGALVLAGRCWDAGGAPAWWPWVQVVRALARRGAPDRRRASALGRCARAYRPS